MQKAIWATRIVSTPRLNPMALKNISVATAVTISGTNSGNEMSPNDRLRRLNVPPLIIAVAARVAIAVETVAATIAITKLFRAADLNVSLSGPTKTSKYQLRLKLSQFVIEADELKL